MSDEEVESVGLETQEAITPAAETEDAQAVRQESVEERKRRNDVEYNWAEARRKMQELDKQNREMQEQLNQLKQKPQSSEDDEIDKLADDDIITKAHAKKLAEKMARQITQEVIRQREAATVDERLQLKYPDFADVVSKENIELLKETEPELADSLRYQPDPYSQGLAAYKLLKKLNISSKSVYDADKEKALKNAQKPLSVNSVTKTSALGNAHLFENGLTPELKKKMYEEMQTAIKRY